MKLLIVVFFAFAMTACTPAQDGHAREQARKAGQELKHDAREVEHEVAVDARKVSHELSQSARKARKALDKPVEPSKEPRTRRT